MALENTIGSVSTTGTVVAPLREERNEEPTDSNEIQTSAMEVEISQSERISTLSETVTWSKQISPEATTKEPAQDYTGDISDAQIALSHIQSSQNEHYAEGHNAHSESQMRELSIGVQVSPVQSSLDISPREVRSPEDTDGQTDGVKKTKRRGSAWTDDQTDFLLEVWASHTDASGNEEYSITNAPIYRIISRSMGELGYLDKTSDQCKCRIHTLKRAYKLTKAEIDAGARSITFCRHYDKLKIIMGDDPTTTPKQLAEILAERRRTKKLTGGSTEAKPKKLKPNSEHKLKRSQLPDSTPQDTKPPKQAYKDVSQLPSTPQVATPLPAVSSLWNHQSYTFPFSVTPPIQDQNLAFSDSQCSSPANTQNVSYQSAQVNTSPNVSYDINHNTNVIVKQEKTEDGFPVYQPFLQKTTEAVSQTKEEIERMRLDLEIKKIEMERNRLEMEERQRREDRDHQYRMMQLLLMGLGHNPTVGSSGQGSETEETHQPELSRAIEGGLVPGGVHSANEKGLSFSEI